MMPRGTPASQTAVRLFGVEFPDFGFRTPANIDMAAIDAGTYRVKK